MKKETIIRKNLELLEEFMKYALEHEDILGQIGNDEKTLIILPDNDPELLKANKKVLANCKRKKRQYVVFRMNMPERSVPELVEEL